MLPNAIPLQTRVLILCAGEGERWGEYLGGPKQLAPICGVPLLVRTVGQVQHYFGVSPVIVTHDPRLHISGCDSFCPKRRRWVVETFLSTAHLWSNRTIVLLGDVLYTDTAMTMCRGASRGLVIFGRRGASAFSGKRYGELFGLSFTREYSDFLIKCLAQVIADAINGGRGKLWELYFLTQRQPPVGLPPVEFCEIHDYTEDFDCPHEYRYLKRLYEWAISPSRGLRILAMLWSSVFCAPYAGWHRWKQWQHDRRKAMRTKLPLSAPQTSLSHRAAA